MNSGTDSRKSSSVVVIDATTSVFGSIDATTSPYSDSSATSALAPESFSRSSTSRSFHIGLIDTMIPPAFQVAIIVRRN